MTAVLRGLSALWLRFCAWRSGYWLAAWQGRQEAAEDAAARYRLWRDRAGLSSDRDRG